VVTQKWWVAAVDKAYLGAAGLRYMLFSLSFRYVAFFAQSRPAAGRNAICHAFIQKANKLFMACVIYKFELSQDIKMNIMV
jgi:hypothetical protein